MIAAGTPERKKQNADRTPSTRLQLERLSASLLARSGCCCIGSPSLPPLPGRAGSVDGARVDRAVVAGYTLIMEPENLTHELLKNIRDELRGLRAGQVETNERLNQTNERLDQTNERLGSLERTTNERFDRLELHQIATNERLDRHERLLERHEQALGLLIETVQGLGGRLDNLASGPLGEKVRDLDRRVSVLEARCEP
jgi:septal ring factor EnvC (AmiA/AmiB activator)